MARRDRVQQALDQLAAVRADPTSAAGMARLEAALGHKSNLVVAAAAQIAGEHEIALLAPRLVAAFERFLVDAAQRDPCCRAKMAIAEALARLHHDAEAIFRRGARHVQEEPVWGGTEDTAAELRAICILALVDEHYPDALVEAADLLADPERAARVGAAHAVGRSGNPEVGVPLLHLKLRTGGEDPMVMHACFASLLALAPDASLPVVAGFLGDPGAGVCEAAALALGESRLAGALAPLRDLAATAERPAERQVALVALALLRSKEAWDHLIDLAARAPADVARDAVNALATYRHDARLRARVEAAVEARGDDALRASVDQAFAGG